MPASFRSAGSASIAACASSTRPASTSARMRPDSTCGWSGAISASWSNSATARSPSPAVSTSSPIAISGSSSASAAVASDSIGSCLSSWSRMVRSCDSVRAGVRSATSCPLEHGVDGRDRLDLELRGDELVLVGVDLGQHHALVGIGGRDLLQQRRQRLARPAPLRPEIDDDEARHRRLDDVAAEALDGFLLGGGHA